MTHELIIRGGHLVEGTGREPFPGDLATLVNGRVNVLDGEHTGERAGQVLRHRQ